MNQEINSIERDIKKAEIIETVKKNLSRMSSTTIDNASNHQIYAAVCAGLRDELMDRLTLARELQRTQGTKQLYYLSVEFLQGRALGNNLLNCDETELYREVLDQFGVSSNEIENMEKDPGLGNGGLGRLASCFLDSLATLDYSAVGCGIRYEYGLFRQLIIDGQQVEMPDAWLDETNDSYPWEVMVAEDAVEVKFGGYVEDGWDEGKYRANHVGYSVVRAVPYDVPIAGYKTENVCKLRLWRALSPNRLDMDSFSRGDYAKATKERELAEVISKVLYPNENHIEGKSLRLKQHYFFTSATVQYIINDFKQNYGSDWGKFSERICLQINDTHPSLAIPEMMRILIDEEGLSWDEAWHHVSSVFNYTNHTVMIEALENWPEDLFKELLPRIYLIVKTINDKYCEKLWDFFPGQWDRIGKMAIVGYNQVRMSNLCLAAAAHVNGVSKLHSDILRQDLFRDAFVVAPWKFLGITNGVTPRRWLMLSNPKLAALLDESIGEAWRTNLMRLDELTPLADDAAFREKFNAVKFENKKQFSSWIKEKQGVDVDPHMIFDVQAKRLHEYKRQLMNALHIIHLYDKLIDDPNFEMNPVCFIFGAKASAAYHIAKITIRLITAVSEMIDKAPQHVRDKIKIVFVENYNVSAAEIMIPAANVSEQISTAGKEASGTGNMKFMLNGALTIGTLDGANVEISEAVGMDNIYIFGKRANEVATIHREASYSAGKFYSEHAELKTVVDYLVNGKLGEDVNFNDLHQVLLFGQEGAIADNYLVLLDSPEYYATQARINKDYSDRDTWTKKSILNTAKSGVFSSDRTIEEYNRRIWHLQKLGFEV